MDKDSHGLKSRFLPIKNLRSSGHSSAAIRVPKYWTPVVLWCGVIFYLSSIPHLSSGLGPWDFFLRKAAHLAEYGILALLLVRALRNTSILSLEDIYAWSLRLSVLYALTDEFHQLFVSGRECSVYDVLVDSLGALFALWIYFFGRP